MSGKLLRVLYVDDDEDDFLLTEACFKEIPDLNYHLVWCSTYQEALNELQKKAHDLYLFDFFLGKHTGIDLMKEAFALQCEGPMILLTGRGDEKTAIETLRMGATDYLIKSELTASTLQRSIRYSVERTAFTKAIQQSERRYRKIFEESGDMLFITDAQGNILDFNPATLTLSGYNTSQLLEASILSFIGTPTIRQIWDTLLRKQELENQEIILITSNGNKRTCIFSAIVESDENQQYVQCRISDITSRKQLERERLFSEKMAVSGRLIRMLAHEVRNPLTNITLSAEQLESEFEDNELAFYTQIIKRNCHRINELITQLLQSSRPGEVNLVPGSMEQVLEEALQTANDRIQLKKIKVIKTYRPDIPVVALDQTSLQLAFLNLINNAIEAVQEATGELLITLQHQAGEVKVGISDNGSGISEEMMNHIFEPYFTGKKAGMGIGLATALSIVHSHGGRIDVQSEEGAGSTFLLSFPTL